VVELAYSMTSADSISFVPAPAPRCQHSDQQAHAERDSNGLIRMFVDRLVSGFRGGDGLFLQTPANLLGLLGCGFQSGSKFVLLVVSMFCYIHSCFPFLDSHSHLCRAFATAASTVCADSSLEHRPWNGLGWREEIAAHSVSPLTDNPKIDDPPVYRACAGEAAASECRETMLATIRWLMAMMRSRVSVIRVQEKILHGAFKPAQQGVNREAAQVQTR
jgi:hypothetical protein